MGTSSVMPSASNPIPYKLRKRTQISYLEIESDNDDLNNSPNEIEITGPPAKVWQCKVDSGKMDSFVTDTTVAAQETGQKTSQEQDFPIYGFAH